MAPYLSSMMNGTLSRVSVRSAQGIGKASPMSNSSSSPKIPKIPKTSKDGKGTVSNNVSKQPKPKKVKSQKHADFVAPKFDTIKGVNCCVNCKKGNHLTDTIVCQLCNTSFHALCKTVSSSNVDETAICTPTFLTSVRPVIAKYGSNAKRWGNFLFVCVNCNDDIKAFMNSKKEERKTLDCGVNTDPELDEAPKTCGSILLSDDDEDRPDKSEELITEVIDQVQIILKGFENGFLSRVDTMLDDKLSSMSSHNLNTMSMRRTPTPSSSSGVWSSASVSSFEPDISSEHSASAPLLAPSFSNVLQITTPPKADIQPFTKESMDDCAKSATDREIELIRNKCSDNDSVSLRKNSPSSNTTDDSQNIIVLRMDKTKSTNLNETKQSVSKILKSVPVINMKENVRDNKVVIQLPSVENKQLAKELLLKSPIVKTANIIVDDTKKMLPKITVANIPNYIFSDIDHKSNTNTVNSQSRELVKSILKQGFMDKNEELRKLVEEEDKTFDIVFVKTGYTYTTAGIRVSPIIRKLLLDQGFVYIADTRSKVSDRLDLKQCFNCQRLGHISTECHDRGVTCMYCSASHRTGTCPEKSNRSKHRCVNCSHSEDESLKSNCHTHHSGEETCPIIVEALERVRCNTEYSKNI